VKKLRLPGGDLEYKVLRTLWELGTASAPEIHARVGEPARLAYTTTAKVLDRLNTKELVIRERKGKSFLYRPKVEPRLVDHASARSMLDRLLGGRPRTAVAALVEAVESMDPRLLNELERAIVARRRSQHGT